MKWKAPYRTMVIRTLEMGGGGWKGVFDLLWNKRYGRVQCFFVSSFSLPFKLCQKQKRKRVIACFFFSLHFFMFLIFIFPLSAGMLSASPLSLRMLTAEGKIKFIFLELFLKEEWRKTTKNETKRGKLERLNSAAIKYDNPYFIKCNYKVIGRSWNSKLEIQIEFWINWKIQYCGCRSFQVMFSSSLFDVFFNCASMFVFILKFSYNVTFSRRRYSIFS